MEESSWSVLIDQIEKKDSSGKTFGQHLLVGSNGKKNFYRKILYLFDAISPLVYLLGRTVHLKIDKNRLLIDSKDLQEFRSVVNKRVVNYVWLTSFLRNTLTLTSDFSKRKEEFRYLLPRFKLTASLLLIQNYLTPKLHLLYDKLFHTPRPKPLRPSYSTYLLNVIKEVGIERAAVEHPYLRMPNIWAQASVLFKRGSIEFDIEKHEKQLIKYYAESIREIQNKEENDYLRGLHLFLYSTLSHFLWLSEWEDYYVMGSRELLLESLIEQGWFLQNINGDSCNTVVSLIENLAEAVINGRELVVGADRPDRKG